MSEMLANRYYLDREFQRALPLFEELLADDPGNARARKKLIVCCIQAGKYLQAEMLFLDLLRETPGTILRNEEESSGEPCQGLASQLERDLQAGPVHISDLNRLGMLSAYFSASKALECFRRSLALRAAQPRIHEMAEIICGVKGEKRHSVANDPMAGNGHVPRAGSDGST